MSHTELIKSSNIGLISVTEVCRSLPNRAEDIKRQIASRSLNCYVYDWSLDIYLLILKKFVIPASANPLIRVSLASPYIADPIVAIESYNPHSLEQFYIRRADILSLQRVVTFDQKNYSILITHSSYKQIFRLSGQTWRALKYIYDQDKLGRSFVTPSDIFEAIEHRGSNRDKLDDLFTSQESRKARNILIVKLGKGKYRASISSLMSPDYTLPSVK